MSKSISRYLSTIAGVVTLAGCTQVPKPPPPPVPPAIAQPMVLQSPTTSAAKDDRDIVSEPRAVMAAQRALIQLGYTVGKVDGVLGPATLRAIRAFQRDHGLVEDERLTFILAGKLSALAGASSTVDINVRPGDMLVYNDGETEIAAVKRTVQWAGDENKALVAVRPATTAWPAAARAGLDWALTHALDGPVEGPAVKWSSTGVRETFQIRTSNLTAREADLVGGAPDSCRRFDMRADEQLRYPGIACRDSKNQWYIPHSTIRFRRPATNWVNTSVNKFRGMSPTLSAAYDRRTVRMPPCMRQSSPVLCQSG